MGRSEAEDHGTSVPAFEPMSFGMILDRMIQLYARNFLLLMGIMVFPEIVLFVISLALAGTQAQQPGTGLSLALAYPFYLLVSTVATGAVTVAISGRYLGREVSIQECYRAAWRKLGRLLGAWIVAGIMIFVGFLLVVPGIIWALSFCLITPVIMLEGLPAGQSRKRSRELTRGARWQILGLYLIYLVAVYGLVIFVALVARVVSGGVPVGPYSTRLVPQLFSLAGRVVLAPFGGIMTVLIYYNQRIRKEGFDLELLAEAMG